MNFSEKEEFKAKAAIYFDEFAKHLPASRERAALGDEILFMAFVSALKVIIPDVEKGERERYLDLYMPGAITFDLRARSEDGQKVDMVRHVISKEQVEGRGRKVLMITLEEILLKIVTSPIVEDWIISPVVNPNQTKLI
jgi:hypothetical protein